MYLIIFFVSVFVGAAQQNAGQRDSSGWVGTYEYEYSEPAEAGQYVPVITYTITIKKKGDDLIAHFTMDSGPGDEYECTTKIIGNRLELYVLEDQSGRDSKIASSLRKGQLLGSLIKIPVRDKTKYKYMMGKYEIVSPRYAALNPVYFKKKVR